MSDRYTCHCCGGSGSLLLTGIYADTLREMRRLCRGRYAYVVSNRDAKAFGCKPTALNNRLSKLEEHGFVFSERYGKQRRFFLCSVKGGGSR